MKPTLLTIDQAAEALSLSRSTVWRLVTAGEITSVKVGSARRIPSAALDAYVVALQEGPR